jgi:hypothetical protein
MGMVNKKEQQMRKSLRQSIEREVKASEELSIGVQTARENGVTDAQIIRYLVAMLSRAEAEMGPKKFEEFHPFNTRYLSKMKVEV